MELYYKTKMFDYNDSFFIVTNFFMSLSTVLVTPVVLAFASVETMGIVTSANGFGL